MVRHRGKSAPPQVQNIPVENVSIIPLVPTNHESTPTSPKCSKIKKNIEKRLKKLKEIDDNLAQAFEFIPGFFKPRCMINLDITINGATVSAIIDTGCQLSTMSTDCAEECGLENLVDTRFSALACGVGQEEVVGKIHFFSFELKKKDFGMCASVLENLKVDLLIGMDFLEFHACVIDLKRRTIFFGSQGLEVQFPNPEVVKELPDLNQSVTPKRKLPQDESSDNASAKVSKQNLNLLISGFKMNFEHLPALQQWLIRILKRLCDADPQALTKYVMALLKKDTCEETLRKSMTGRLKIFLQDETKKFVDRLFDVLHTGVYKAEFEVPTLSVTVTNSSCENSPVKPSTSVHSDVPPLEDENKVLAEAGISKISKGDSPNLSLRIPPKANSVETSSSSESQGFEGERGTNPINILAVERSCLWRDKRSCSSSTDCSDKEQTKMNGGVGSSKNAARTKVSRGRRRVRTDVERKRRTRSPLRPRSVSQNLRFRNRPSISDRSRSRSILELGKRPTCHRPPSPGESNSLLDSIANKCSVKSEIVKPVKDEKKDGSEARNRCRDFDERGLCLQGELCPFDHGLDPVVLHEVVNNESGGKATAEGSTSFSGKIPCEKPVNFMNTTIMPVWPPPGISDEYYPESPSIIPPPPMPPFGWNMHRRPMRPRHMLMDPFSGRGGMLRPPMVRHMDPPLTHGQRQLISIPVEGIARPNGPHPPASMMPENPFAMAGARIVCRALFGMRGRGGGRGAFDHSRLGTRPGKPINMNNCCLEVRKIPRELNKIETLINHFSRFGHVVSIQISFDNDPEGALVIFGSHAEAFQAYRSTDAVLNNRFIRVFWHNKNPLFSAESLKPGDDRRQSNPVGPAPSFIPVPKPINVSPMESNVDLKREQSVNRAKPPLVLQQEPQVMKTPTKIKNDAQRKQEMMTLMNAQINEQKQLISKLESDRSRMTSKQRDEVMKMIKALQASCEELKTNISNCGNGGSNTTKVAAGPGPSESEKSLAAQHNGFSS